MMLLSIVFGMGSVLGSPLVANAQDAQKPAEQQVDRDRVQGTAIDSGSSGNVLKDWFGIDIPYLIAYVAAWIMGFASSLLGLAAIFMNAAILLLVVKMGSLVNNASGITVAWTVLRDIANIFFVFSLLLIGIATILGLQSYGYRQLLVRLIVVALLINFSLYGTKVVIDISNLLSANIYSLITTVDDPDLCATDDPANNLLATTAFEECMNGGLALGVMSHLGISDMWSTKDIVDRFAGAGSSPPGSNSGPANYWKAARLAVFGTILFIIVAFVFFAATIMLVSRFIVLVILLILSPVAFAAMILPATRSISFQWWSALWRNSFFAPAFLLLIWISLLVLDGLRRTGYGTEAFGTDPSSLYGVLEGQFALIPELINYMIVIGLFIASLIIAKKIGAYGANFAINQTRRPFDFAGRKARGLAAFGAGYLGASTVGFLGSKAGRGYNKLQAKLDAALAKDSSQKWYSGKNLLKGTGRLGRGAVNIATLGAASDQAINAGFNKVSSAKFGGDYSYNEIKDVQKKRKQELQGERRDTELSNAIKYLANDRNRLLGATYNRDTGEYEYSDAYQAQVDVLKSATAAELDALQAGTKNKIYQGNVAELLNTNTYQRVLDNENLSEQDKKRLKDARFANTGEAAEKLKKAADEAERALRLRNEALARGDDKEARAQDQARRRNQELFKKQSAVLDDRLSNFNTSDRSKLSVDILKNTYVAQRLNPEDLRAINRDRGLRASERYEIYDGNPNNPFYNSPYGRTWINPKARAEDIPEDHRGYIVKERSRPLPGDDRTPAPDPDPDTPRPRDDTT